MQQPGQTDQPDPTQPMTSGNLNWLVDNLARTVEGIVHVTVQSTDGLLLAKSKDLDMATANEIAAVTSGLSSLAQTAAVHFGGERVTQTIVEMDQGYLFVMTISDSSTLSVLAQPDSDTGVIAYEMTLLVARVGDSLTPPVRAELHAAMTP
jgi:predicted regulator of Ras-like GTPase activity (Roadblock/LC7/MglB family)